MNNSYNIGGSIYTGLGELNTGKNNYLFVSNGSRITFLRRTPNNNYQNNLGGKFYPIALEDYNWSNIIIEDMILNNIADRLTKMYGIAKTEVTLDNISAYLSYAALELQKLGNLEFDIDPNLSMVEKETVFKEKANTLANDIDNTVMARMRSNNKDVVDNYYKDTNLDLSLQSIIGKLSLYDLNNITELVKNSDDPLKVTLEYLSNRDDIKELVNNGMSRLEAINHIIMEGKTVEEVMGLEKPKVKTKGTPNQKIGTAAYIDTIVLCLFAQLTIFLVLLGILFLIK